MFSKGNKPTGAPGPTPAPSNMAPSPAPLTNSSSSASAAPKPAPSAVPSIISADLKIVGNMHSSGDIQVDGQVEGDVLSRTLTIGEGAIVKGSVRGETVRICGQVHGEVNAGSVIIAKTARVSGDVVHQSLARVGATHLARKQIGELSGGQQQRVFIARALAQEAELLLLDEPLNGLDLPSQQAIFDILDGLRPDGVTVLVATHDLQLAADRFDKIMLLNRRIVAFAGPTAVLTPDNLLQAYGGHVHVLPGAEQGILVDDCCGHDEPVNGER